VLDLGGKKVRCYVLNNGERFLNTDDLGNFFGMPIKEAMAEAEKIKKRYGNI
jgi:hypothetical protein